MKRIKPVSKRRWKARLRMGRWIPRLVIECWSMTAPEGMKLVWHHTEDFMRLMPEGVKYYRDVHVDDIKRAWE